MHEAQNLDLESLLLDPPDIMMGLAPRTNKSKNRFLRGPIDWRWLTTAARLPGSAVHVALAIHYQNGFELTGKVRLSPSVWREMGLKRHTVYRAVDELEKGGLISVVRKRGCSPIISICLPERM